MQRLLSPAFIFSYGLTHATVRRAKMVKLYCDRRNVGERTVNKYANENESTYRANDIDRLGDLYEFFFHYSRAAAFLIRDFVLQMERRLMNTPTSQEFSPAECVSDVARRFQQLQQLQLDGNTDTREYLTKLTEIEAAISLHKQRLFDQDARAEKEPDAIGEQKSTGGPYAKVARGWQGFPRR